MSSPDNRGPIQEGQRTRPRDSLLLMGTIKAVGDVARQTQPMRVRNLSSTGLMADSEAAYDVGCTVELGLRGIGTISGEVIWVRDGRMGITFHQSVDPKLARQPVVARPDDSLRKIVTVGNIRRPGLRIG